MLTAAATLFEQRGYVKTTMDQIAERAGVGVATVYKYFGSKEHIVEELVLPDLQRVFDLGERILERPPEDPADATVALLKCYMELRNGWHDRRLLRMVSVPAMLDAHGVLGAIVESSDARAIEQIRDLLRVMQMRGRVPTGVNLADMATVVFAVFNHEYFVYVMHDDIPAARVFADIERLVRALFQPWRIEHVPPS